MSISELIFLIVWFTFWFGCGLISVYLNYKEYQLILKSGYYRDYPDSIHDYILFTLIGPFGLTYSIPNYLHTKRKVSI